ncbi:MAG TPA: Uma2 family endonuclease [Chloroflexota bacterium]|nr:Uma2 family endonuclease [Chloroflexota bacterium]HUM68661.1 Uma2 family endonuclease [Chloroflexota bacterium]
MSTPTAVATPTKHSPKLSPKLITGEELYAMGDIGPSELVKGEIKYHIPTGHPHGYFESLIAFFLTMFVREHKSGRVLTGEVGIYTDRNPDTVRAADVIFISHKRFRQARSAGYLDVAPELVVEVMSPDNTWSEVQKKLAEYFAVDVLMVWVVDPQLEQVHVYRSPEQMKLLRKEDALTGGDVLPGFQVALTEIFTAE